MIIIILQLTQRRKSCLTSRVSKDNNTKMLKKEDLIIIKSTDYFYDEFTVISNYYQETLYTTILYHLSMFINYIASASA